MDCSFTMPGHCIPPTGDGSRHSRTRSLTPSPQLTLHKLHGCHGPQSSAKPRNKQTNKKIPENYYAFPLLSWFPQSALFFWQYHWMTSRSKITSLLTCAPVNHQAGLCRTRGATEVEHKPEAVGVPSHVKQGTVEFCFIFSLSQPVKGQRRRCRLIWTKSQWCCSSCSYPRGGWSFLSWTCILVQQHFATDVGTWWGHQFHCHGPLTTTPVRVAVVHQELVGENTRQVERSRAFHILCYMRRSQSHSYEVLLREGKDAGQLNALGLEGSDGVPRAGSDLVDAFTSYLVVLHVADL